MGGSFDETKLWGLRANLCNDPLGQMQSAGGRLVETRLYLGHIRTTYSIWARDKDGSHLFQHCWEATQNLIEQCARSGQSAGTWEWDGEFYAMSGSSGPEYGRRGNFSVSDLQTLPPSSAGTIQDIVLENGTYNVLGVPVRLAISGIDLSPARYARRRARGPVTTLTNDGSEVTNFTIIAQPRVDLPSVIQEAVSELLGTSVNASASQMANSKRDQKCMVNRKYVMIEYGHIPESWVPYNVYSSSEKGAEISPLLIPSESFSIGIGEGVSDIIAEAARSLSLSWDRSHTTTTKATCKWTQGSCHSLSLSQPVAYQLGFLLEAQVLPTWDYRAPPPVLVDIKFVRSETPDGPMIHTCSISCCSPKNIERFGMFWDMCKYAAGKECYYGTCANWEEDCNGIGQTC